MIKDELETMYASLRKLTESTHSIVLTRHSPDERAPAKSDATKPAATRKRPSAKRG